MLGNRDAEHVGGGLAVDVPALPEQVQSPCFASQPCDDSGFDGAEVRDDEAAPLARDEGGTDQLGQGAGQRVDADSGIVDALIQGVGCPLGLGQGCLARRLPRATSTSMSAWL